jgi:hypothetical protein
MITDGNDYGITHTGENREVTKAGDTFYLVTIGKPPAEMGSTV